MYFNNEYIGLTCVADTARQEKRHMPNLEILATNGIVGNAREFSRMCLEALGKVNFYCSINNIFPPNKLFVRIHRHWTPQ